MTIVEEIRALDAILAARVAAADRARLARALDDVIDLPGCERALIEIAADPRATAATRRKAERLLARLAERRAP
ncbi:MAG: hypothetical protein KIT31_13855 [Deltaproteobacteria bacterium]|nr:hypothetical protein [Deltaproteobacteria bacterium]